MLAVLVVIFLLVVTACSGNEGSGPTTTTAAPSTTTAAPSTTTRPPTTTTRPPTTTTRPPTTTPRTVGFDIEGNRSVQHGGIRFTLLNIEKFGQVVSLDDYEHTAKSSWLVVTLRLERTSDDGLPTYKSKDQILISNTVGYPAEHNMRGVDDSQWVTTDIESIPLFFDVPETFPEDGELLTLNLFDSASDSLTPGIIQVRARRGPTTAAATTSTTRSPTTTTTTTTTTTVSPATTATEPINTTTTRPPLAGIGDPVRDGKFEFVVIDVEQPGKTLRSGGLEDEALGTWFIVRIKVTNIGEAAQTFFASNQKLTFGAATYDPSYTWNGTNVEDVNPGLSFEAIVPFDVPEGFPRDGVGTILTLHDSVFSGGVEVWL